MKERYVELYKDYEARDQMNKMKVQKRMNDTRNPKIKELILSTEVIKENIADFENKLAEEKAKYNKLLDETIEFEKTQANLQIELFHTRLDNQHLAQENGEKAAASKALKEHVDAEEAKLNITRDSRDKLEFEVKDL